MVNTSVIEIETARNNGYANLEGAYVILEISILKAHTSCRLVPLFLPID
jgi:hypothetical protein